MIILFLWEKQLILTPSKEEHTVTIIGTHFMIRFKITTLLLFHLNPKAFHRNKANWSNTFREKASERGI